jgi:DNA-binding transcriptional LysR family regulator
MRARTRAMVPFDLAIKYQHARRDGESLRSRRLSSGELPRCCRERVTNISFASRPTAKTPPGPPRDFDWYRHHAGFIDNDAPVFCVNESVRCSPIRIAKSLENMPINRLMVRFIGLRLFGA